MTKNSIRPPFEHTAPLPYTLCNQKHLQTNRNILKKTQTNINKKTKKQTNIQIQIQTNKHAKQVAKKEK